MNKVTLISPVLIIALGFLVYGNSLKGKFLWDDKDLVEKNAYIKDWSNLPKLFTGDIGAGSGNRTTSYRPLQMLTLTADYYLWKLNVTGYHLTNTVLHILAALSIFWFAAILFNNRLISLLAAVLFVVHPIHTEAVSYISGRSDSLVTIFMLLAFIFYIKALRDNSFKNHALLLFSYLLALLSKESSLILPALLLLFHLAFKKKIRPQVFLPVLAIAIAYCLLRLTLLKFVNPAQALLSPPTTLMERIPGFFVAITNYIKLLLLPFNLHMEYGGPLFKFSEPKAVSGVIILCSLIIIGFKKRASNKLLFFCIFWFLITLLPVSHLYPINAYMAEHWMYLPSIGLFFICAKGLGSLYDKKALRPVSLFVIVSLLAFYSYLTIRQNDYWREPEAFYERTLKYVPGSARVLHNLATLYSDSGRKDQAIALYKKAIEINPNIAQTYHNLGLTYSEAGNKQEAIASFKKALELDPKFLKAYNDLGLAYSATGDKAQAIEYFKRAAEIDRNNPNAYINLGMVYTDLGKTKEAAAYYGKALSASPDLAQAHYNLGVTYYLSGNKEGALASFGKAVELDPAFSKAYNNLGLVYSDMGEKGQALKCYKRALEINPDNPDAHNNLAVFYYYEGQYDLAVRECDIALKSGHRVSPEFLELIKPYRK